MNAIQKVSHPSRVFIVAALVFCVTLCIFAPRFAYAQSNPLAWYSCVTIFPFDDENEDFEQGVVFNFSEGILKTVGGVSYDKTTNTVTLNGCHKPNSWVDFYNMGDDLKVNLVGNNELASMHGYAAQLGAGINFIGTGSLTLKAEQPLSVQNWNAYLSPAARVTISDSTTLKLTATGLDGCIMVENTILPKNQALSFGGIASNNAIGTHREESYEMAITTHTAYCYDTDEPVSLKTYDLDDGLGLWGIYGEGSTQEIYLERGKLTDCDKYPGYSFFEKFDYLDEVDLSDFNEDTYCGTVDAYLGKLIYGEYVNKGGVQFIASEVSEDEDDDSVVYYDIYQIVDRQTDSVSDEHLTLKLAESYVRGDWDGPNGYTVELTTKPVMYSHYVMGSTFTHTPKTQTAKPVSVTTSAGLAVGKTAVVEGITYKVTNNAKAIVTFQKAAKSKASVTVPATVTIKGKKYAVTGIAKQAFKGTKAKKVTIKSAKLTKKSVKGCLKGSKVNTVKVPKAKKKAYKKIFTKKNVGRKVRVK